MKVLIIGTYNLITDSLIARLKREKHSIYILCGSKYKSEKGSKYKNIVEYPFEITDANNIFIVEDMKPDAVVFCGAYDPDYNWNNFTNTQNQFLTGLSNMLSICAEANVPRFIYLSAVEQGLQLNRTRRTQKQIAFDGGENLCLGYSKSGMLNVLVLRFTSIYGVKTQQDEDCGELSNFIESALGGQKNKAQYPSFSPVYVSDAVDAVYKLITAKSVSKDRYTVSGKVKVNCHALLELMESGEADLNVLSGKIFDSDTIFEAQSADGEFENEFKFHQIILPQNGIAKVIKSIQDFNENAEKRRKKEEKTHKIKNFFKSFGRVFKYIMPLIENLLMFVFFQYVVLQFYPNPPQVYLFYIVFISALFGRRQLFVALALAVFSYTFFNAQETSLLLLISNVQYTINVLIMVTGGFTVSWIRDKLNSITTEKTRKEKLLNDEIDGLTEMLITNRKVRSELETRLLSNQDNLSRIYEIVSRLDAVETRKVFYGALDVVSDIMHSNDISIYMSSNNLEYFRCVASSTPFARESLPNSIKLKDYSKMYEPLLSENVFVNRELDEGLPKMAVSVDVGGYKSNVVIMLWSIGFEDLSLYHVNLFLVLRMIITTSIHRAYQYEHDTQQIRYLGDTNILNKEYFAYILEDQKTARQKNDMPFEVLRVVSAGGNLKSLSDRLTSVLRTTDYIGMGEDGNVYLLLTGMTEEFLSGAVGRLNNKEVYTERLDKDIA